MYLEGVAPLFLSKIELLRDFLPPTPSGFGLVTGGVWPLNPKIDICNDFSNDMLLFFKLLSN